MNRFQSFIKRIGGEDKVLHFETCCLITMVVALLNMNVLGLGISVSAVLACMIAIIAGILKEAYDYYTYGLFDNKDIVADVLGAFAGLLIIILIG
jgi:VanZ family protein